jgi:hypothetical protein
MTRVNKFLSQIFEMPLAGEEEKSQVYYHGTSKEQAGISILKDGIQPPDLTDRKGFLKPVQGKVYLTPSLETAIVYALGGYVAGHDLSQRRVVSRKGTEPSWIERDGRYGYVFVIRGEDLQDIQPDEDSVGELLSGLMSTEPNHWLCQRAKRIVAPSRLKQVKNGEYVFFASVGKQLMKHLSAAEKLEIVRNGGHLAHEGAVQPCEAWRFDKTLCPKLQGYGPNEFFALAEKVK